MTTYPPTNLANYWALDPLGPPADTVQCPTLATAQEEAKRQAATSPGRRFYVFQSMGFAATEQAAIWHPALDSTR